MKVIIIGGVAAGMSAAAKIARMSPSTEIVVYEKGGFLSYGACGLPYYVGGFNDDYQRMIARTKEQFEKSGICCFTHHEVKTVDVKAKEIIVEDKKGIRKFVDTYDKLMIATGATAVMPVVPGNHLIGVHTLKTMEEGLFLKEYAKSDQVKHVTIVGAGYIGVECAEAFLNLGKKVRMIEATNQMLTTFDPDISEYAKKELQEKGVQIHLEERLNAFYGDVTVEKIETDKGIYDTDLVIVAVGIHPATQFLEGVNIARSEKGAIMVNRRLETSISDIYAAGDCCLVYNECLEEEVYIPLGTAANKCGRIAGANIVGGREEFQGMLGSAAIKVCDLEFGRTGMGEMDAKRKEIDYKVVVVKAKDHPVYYPDSTPIIIKLLYETKTKRIVGAQACGEKGAVLRVDMFAIAIHGKMTTDELGMIDLIYAPPFAGVWDAVHIACNAAK